LTQNRSFWRRSFQPISWFSTKETKPKTTKANNKKTKWQRKNIQKAESKPALSNDGYMKPSTC